MKQLSTRLIFILTAILFATGVGVWFLLKEFFPSLLIDTYPAVPLFFWLMGLIFIGIMMKMPRDKPRKMVNSYMLLRVIKILVGLTTIAIYWFIDRKEIRSFVIIFILFYLVYLILETYIYLKMEMFLKEEHKKHTTVKKKRLEDS